MSVKALDEQVNLSKFRWVQDWIHVFQRSESIVLHSDSNKELCLGFLSLNIHKSRDRSKGGRLFLTAVYHVVSFHMYLDISRAITAYNSTLHRAIGQKGCSSGSR